MRAAQAPHHLLYVREISPLLDFRVAVGTAIFFFGGPFSHVRHRVLNMYAVPGDGSPADNAGGELAEVEGRAA